MLGSKRDDGAPSEEFSGAPSGAAMSGGAPSGGDEDIPF
jgi:hypothetical protein